MMKSICVVDTSSYPGYLDDYRDCLADQISSTATPWAFTMTHAVAILVPVLVLIGVWITVHQRQRADRNDQLWKRMEWAFGEIWSGDDDRKMTALLALESLISDNGKAGDFRLNEFDRKLLNDVSDSALPPRP
jgi:hypothetical protein